MGTEEEIKKSIVELEDRLSIPAGFFERLRKEDDWSFVIKAHALLEASLSHWISVKLGHPELLGILTHLDTSDPKRGKVGFLKKLNQLENCDSKFISALSELRNNLVHNVANTAFSFEEYVQRMDKNQKKSFCNSFGLAYLDEDANGRDVVLHHEQILTNPKLAIWHGLRVFLAIANMTMDLEEKTKAIQQMKLETVRYYQKIFDLTS